MMVTDLGIVHKTLVRPDGLGDQSSGDFPVGFYCTRLQPLPDRLSHIFSDITGIGSGIGQHLVGLIETLHDVQRLLCRKSEAAAGIPLKLRQVIEPGGKGFLGALLHGAYGHAFPRHLAQNLLCPFLLKGSETSALSIPEAPSHLSSGYLDAIVFSGAEMFDFFLPLSDHRQGRRLYTSAGKLGVVLAGQGTGRIDSHQPVSLCSRHSRCIQIIVLPAITEVSETFPDCLIRDRRDPEPFDGFAALRFFQNPSRHQLTFPSSIGGDHNGSDVFSEQLLFNGTKLPGGFLDHHKLHLLRQHGKRCQIPFDITLVVFFWIC